MQLFAALRHFLELERAAFLLPANGDDYFAPWAVIGFDQTTERRLRLPASFVNDLLGESKEAHFIESDETRAQMRPYLSTNELGSEESMLIFPFTDGSRVLALLVIGASPYLEHAPSVLRVILSAVVDDAVSLLIEHRTRQLESVPNRAIFAANELADTPLDLLSAQREPLVAIRVDAGPLLRSVREHFAEADRFRVKQDIARIIAAVCAELGIVVDQQDDTLLLFLSRHSELDLPLLQHHMRSVVRHIFLDTSEEFELPMESFPQGDASKDEFARAFL